ncbi:MAG: response regulator transcription factor [Candidatus Thermoplasmatota archaeon]|nr:response regulator transcription factor [Candidatus Thermoplasmatota archaeon]
MMKILIADDHAIVRQGLRQILTENSGMCTVDEAENGHQVLEKISKEEFGVLVLDICMPGENGIEILKTVRQLSPDLPVLMLSMYSEDQYAIRALKAGASGYLTKDKAPDVLIQAINKVAEGRKYISPILAEKLADNLYHNKNNRVLHELLSDREYEVMCHIASGKTVSQIGQEMNLSVKTISTYRSRILDKMKMKTNAELTHYAIKNNLI